MFHGSQGRILIPTVRRLLLLTKDDQDPTRRLAVAAKRYLLMA